MMKVVIVEDEIRIRDGMVNLIKKISNHNEIIFCAENGKEGLKLILKERPDIIITDICMPEMDGLSMLNQLKEEGGELPKVIILSAYSDFEYARSGLRLGIHDYILKPVSVSEFSSIYRNIVGEILREKEQIAEAETINLLDTVLLQTLYYSIPLNDGIREKLVEKYELQPSRPSCFVLFYLGKHFEERANETEQALRKVFCNLHEAKYYLWNLPEEKMIGMLLYNYQSFQVVERWLQRQAVLGVLHRISYIKCIGMTEVDKLEHLKDSFKVLSKYLEWSIVLGDEIVISYPKVKSIQTVPVIYPIFLEREVKESLCMMDWKKVHDITRRFVDYFQSGSVYIPQEIKKSFIKFVWAMLNVMKEIDNKCYESLEQEKILEQLMQAYTFHELNDTLVELVQYMEDWEMSNKIDCNLLVQRMKSMIHEFYNQGITLDEIAIALQMTPEYLGTQFHKEVGVTYSVYLKQYRIEKAKKLLLGTELKVYEIARQVGYFDAKYFSRVFKEIEGELPIDYRRRLKA